MKRWWPHLHRCIHCHERFVVFGTWLSGPFCPNCGSDKYGNV